MRQSALTAGSVLACRRRGWPAGRLDALVWDGDRLAHFRRRLDRPDRRWELLGFLPGRAGAPGWLDWVDGHLAAAVPHPDGLAGVRLTAAGWFPAPVPRRPQPPAWLPTARQLGVPESTLRGITGFTAGRRRQVLTDEDGSIFGYQQRRDGRWERASCLRVAEPGGVELAGAAESVKLAQVSGELDATPADPPRPTLSRSVTTSGLLGTDLGVRVEHRGRSLLLFGDSHWAGRPWLSTRDAIAELVPSGPLAGLPGVRFHGSPLKLIGAGATQREYDVPLDGFSAGDRLHVFFSSNHFRDHRVMGRSLIARAVEPDPVIDPAARRRPIRFRSLGTFSDRHFINVSAQLGPAAAVPGCGVAGDVLLVWGTGPYRAAELRLAVLAVGALTAGPPWPVRYWAGDGWSAAEEAARPLFHPAALGEISVRWVPAVGRYLLLSAAGPQDPAGPAITLRSATQPWGPWSDRLVLLDWVATGMAADDRARFIRAHAADPIGERLFRGQGAGGGAAYAPHLFSAELAGADLVLRYTLSTWNPYQVVLMEHRLPVAQLG